VKRCSSIWEIQAQLSRFLNFFQPVVGYVVRAPKTRINLYVNRSKPNRMLEIGPGPKRISGFETLNIVYGGNVDYIWDASKKLPFDNETFDLIYASHILEHVPWYQTDVALAEWVRILKRGGHLEVWVPDGLKICKALVDFELNDENYIDKDGWYHFNEEKSPYKWASGRIYTYGDGTGNPNDPNWHRALFTPRYLKQVLENAGLHYIRRMNGNEVRGHDHGWINLGMTGTK
jgi:SAM-dependent methyltransferase